MCELTASQPNSLSPGGVQDVTADVGPGRLWGPWATIGLGLIIAFCYLVAQTAVVIIAVIVAVITGVERDPEILAETVGTNGFVLAIAICFSGAVGLGLTALVIKLLKGSTIAGYLGLRRVKVKTVLAVIGLAATLAVASDCLSMLLGRPILHEFILHAYSTSFFPPLLWLAVIVVAPAFEEVFFRGFLLQGLRGSRIGNTGAVVLTSLAWTAIHLQYGPYEMVSIFVLGIFLGFVRLKTGSLWCCLAAHSLWNTIATVQTVIYLVLKG